MTAPTRMTTTTLVVLLACALLGAAVATALRPGTGSVSGDSRIEGDAGLATAALEAIPDSGVYALSVAEVTPAGTRTATVGAPLEGTFEIGSVSKPVTGMLLADAVERGDLAYDTTLGEILGTAESPNADITLGELAQHRSGLPRLPVSLTGMLDSLRWLLLAQNPYRDEPADVLDDAMSASVGDPEPAYSNLGYATLGHALAEATGREYPELVRTRLAEPLGLDGFAVPARGAGQADPLAVQGRESSGRSQQAWDDPGYAPAGGIRADAASMARLLDALLAGTAPGSSALTPVTEFDDDTRIGAGWITRHQDGRDLTWHNGQTGGFNTWVGLDPARGTAIFLSGATTHDLGDAGRELLARAAQDVPTGVEDDAGGGG